ncbi:MAG: polysaccharide biosynthesis/export family protein [Pseudomonadota bacterium]
MKKKFVILEVIAKLAFLSCRHCEHSEAIQSKEYFSNCIATHFFTKMLAMTNFTIALIFSAFLFSCSSVVTKPSNISELNLGNFDNSQPYYIGIGDELDIKFFFVPRLDDTVTVRPDGKISVMFAQDVQAEGKTPEELADILRKKLARHLKQPDILVSVSSFASRKVYVGGEVQKPGTVQLINNYSLMQVLGEAGFITPFASKDEIIILRRNDEGKEKVYHVNLANIVSGEDTNQDVKVKPGDVILVPPSNPVAFDRWMDQNVKQALPFSLGASYIYSNQRSSGILK